MNNVVPGRPGRPGPPTPCERQLEAKNVEIARLREEMEAKNVEIARLKEQVAELERQLEDTKRPYRIRPHSDMGPGGPGSGP
jgi:hypothetical protein